MTPSFAPSTSGMMTARKMPPAAPSPTPQRLAPAALDAILALQLTVAWAGEAAGDPPRLGWWKTDLVDREGGGDLFARLVPRTAAWASLGLVRAAARRHDDAARAKLGGRDDLWTLFHFGFTIDEQLGDRLAHHRVHEHVPSEVFGDRLLVGAPWSAQRERRAQKRTKPRRCQPITVSGFTTTRVSAHRDHARERTTQNARSTGRNLGHGPARRRTASCWRRARFSATRLARGRRPAMSAAAIKESRAITAAPLPSSTTASCRRHGGAHGGDRRGAGRPRHLATLFRRARLRV